MNSLSSVTNDGISGKTADFRKGVFDEFFADFIRRFQDFFVVDGLPILPEM